MRKLTPLILLPNSDAPTVEIFCFQIQTRELKTFHCHMMPLLYCEVCEVKSFTMWQHWLDEWTSIQIFDVVHIKQ